MVDPLSRSDFESMVGLDDWRFLDGAIQAEFRFSSFHDGATFVVTIAASAEEADHHPDVSLRYPGIVTVVLSTHDAGAVTVRDVELARAISRSANAAADP